MSEPHAKSIPVHFSEELLALCRGEIELRQHGGAAAVLALDTLDDFETEHEKQQALDLLIERYQEQLGGEE